MPYDAILTERFGADAFTTSAFRDNRRVIVPPERLFPILECLKNECGFDMLVDLTAVDYLHYPDARDRFGVKPLNYIFKDGQFAAASEIPALLATGLSERKAHLEHLNFFIDDTPALSIAALRTRARRLKRTHGLGLLIVDYLQLLAPSGRSRQENRVQ